MTGVQTCALPICAGPRHTAQEQPFEAVIQYPHHPRAGECVTVLRRVVHAGCIHFLIEQPDGWRLLLQAWMTKNHATMLPIVAVPRLSFSSLRELQRLIEALQVSSLPSSEATQTDGGDDGTAPESAATRSSRAGEQRNRAPATQSSVTLRNHNFVSDSSNRVRRHQPKRGGRR